MAKKAFKPMMLPVPEWDKGIINTYNSVVNNSNFLNNFNTPEDQQKFTNYSIGKVLEQGIGASPFKEVSPYKSIYDDTAKPLDITEQDAPEQQAMKSVYNRLIKFKGTLPEPSFLSRTIGNTNINGWWKMITGGKDLAGMAQGFSVDKDGIEFKGQKLKLTPQETDLLSKYISRNTGQDDTDRSFIDKVAESAVSLVWDTPLLMLTGAVAGKAMQLTDATQALMSSNSLMAKATGQVLQQSINFNIMGFPQTVESTKVEGINGLARSIFHNVEMGSLAAITGTMGTAVSRAPVIKKLLAQSPALREELGALGGSLGFGYISGKAEGLSNEDALAQSLAFAATHFTNPKAYERVLAEQKNRGVGILTDNINTESGKQLTFLPDYFIENKKDGTIQKIDTGLFKEKGQIVPLDREPIKMTEENKKNFVYYNQIEDLLHGTFIQELKKIRQKKSSDALFNNWSSQLDPKYVKDNEMELRTVSNYISDATTAVKWTDAFKKWKVPDSKELDKFIYKVGDDYNIPYSDVKDFIISNLPEYVKDSDGFAERLKTFTNKDLSKGYTGKTDFLKKTQDDLLNTMKEAAKAKQEQMDKDIANASIKSLINNSKNAEDDYVKENFKDTGDPNKNMDQIAKLKKEFANKAFDNLVDTSTPKKEDIKQPKVSREDEIRARIFEIDNEIKTKYPGDEALELLNFTDERSKEPQAIQDLLVERDKLNSEKHDLVAERRAKEGKQDIDISRVATPENRQKNLTKEFDFNPEKDSSPNPETSKKVTELKDNTSFTDLHKTFKAPEQLKWLFEAADKLGIKFKVNESDSDFGTFNDVTNKITLNKKYFAEDSGSAEWTRNATGVKPDDKGVYTTLTHEIIHGLISSPKLLKESAPELLTELKKLQSDVANAYSEDLKVVGNKVPMQLRDIIETATADHPTELVTYALTEPRFAEYLDSIPASKDANITSGETVWGRLKNWIREVAGKIIGLPKSKLDELTSVLDKYTSIDKQLNDSNIKDNITEPVDKTPKIAPENRKPPSNEQTALTNTNVLPIPPDALKRVYGNSLAKKFEDAYSNIRHSKISNEDPAKHEKSVELEKLIPFSQAKTEMQEHDIQEIKPSGLVDLTPEGFKKMSESDKIIDLTSNLKKYMDLNLPPIFKAEFSEDFKNNAYLPGEELIRMMPYQVNRIVENSMYQEKWRKMAGITGTSGLKGEIKITKDAQDFLDAIKTYEYNRYKGALQEDLSWNQFADWAGFNPQQRDVLNAMKEAQREAIERMKEIKTKFITEYDDNLTNALGEKVIDKFFGLKKGEGYDIDKLNKQLKEDPELKQRIVKFLVDEQYADWGRRFHYNSVRPASPDTRIVEAVKSNKKDNLKGTVYENTSPEDRISTYFYQEKDKNAFIEKAKSQGYRITQDYRIGDIMKDKSQWSKLNAHQLIELANEGHIALDNDVIQRLLDATKRGVDVHSINKEYIPGMRYTPEEFEGQIERFIREAINGNYKAYYFTKIDRNLLKWESKLTPLVKSGKFKEKMRLAQADLDYARRYLNQLKSPERTVIDKLRGATIAYQVGGIKPSFLFMQASQIFQTSFPQLIQEMKKNNGSVGDAVKMFNRAFANSIKIPFMKEAERTGMRVLDNNELPGEAYQQIRELERMNKVGSTGIAELTSESGEKDFMYSTGASKYFQSMHRVMTYLGKGVERWTRTQTALSFYELGKSKGLSGMELTNYIADNIDRTMSEWGKGGRAPLLDSASGNPQNSTMLNALKKSFMTYKTFSFYNYGMWRSMLHDKDHAALWTKFAVGTGMHGITKFPLFAGMFYIANLFLDDKDNMDHEMWKLADNIDKIIPNAGGILHRGLLSTIKIDARDMFGEDTPIASDLWANSWANSWEGKVADITMGAPLGFTKDIVSGLDQVRKDIWNQITDNTINTEDDIKRGKRILLKLSPVFIRNVFNAMNYEKDGIEVRGKTMVFRDDLNAYDIALKVMSFPLEKQSKAYDEASYGAEAQYNKYKQILSEGSKFRSELIRQGLSKERINNEMKHVVEMMNEARQKIRELAPEVRKLKHERILQNNK